MNAIVNFAKNFISESIHTVNWKNLAWVVGFWVVVLLTIVGSITLLDEHYPNPVRPDDLLFELIPQTDAFLVVSELAGWGLAILSVYAIASRRFREAPSLLFQVGMLFWLRAFTIVLTPLAEINPPAFGDAHILAKYIYRGMFYSGHTGSAFTQYFFFSRRADVPRWVKRIQLTLACLIGFSMVVSHAHYTIDVFAAPFVAYFITHYDFIRWVPRAWRGWRWAPWYSRDTQDVYLEEELQDRVAVYEI
jgi:hypothetical protein